jgi:hypothetical protein
MRRPELEADNSPPSTDTVKNVWNFTSILPYVFMAWCLVKHKDNLTFTYSPVFPQYLLEFVSKNWDVTVTDRYIATKEHRFSAVLLRTLYVINRYGG